MAQERPLDLNEFFQSRNEIANAHGGKLELQAMGRVREHMVEDASKQVVNFNKAEGKKICLILCMVIMLKIKILKSL